MGNPEDKPAQIKPLPPVNTDIPSNRIEVQGKGLKQDINGPNSWWVAIGLFVVGRSIDLFTAYSSENSINLGDGLKLAAKMIAIIFQLFALVLLFIWWTRRPPKNSFPPIEKD